MNRFRSAETVFSELCPGQFLTVCLDKLLAETWAVVTSIVIKWSQDDSWLFYRPLPRNVSQVENQAAKTELLKLKYYSASCRLRDSQGSRNSDKLPARRGGGRFLNYPSMYNEICCKSYMQN